MHLGTGLAAPTPPASPPRPPPFHAHDPSSHPPAGGAGGGTTYEALRRADAAWARLRTAPVGAATGPAPQFVRAAPGPLPSAPKYDAVIAGGTLGVLVGAALAARGHRVAVVEAGALRGRAQEWNISREELGVLVRAGALGRADADAAVVAEFNPVREVWGRVGGRGGGGKASPWPNQPPQSTPTKHPTLLVRCGARLTASPPS